MVSGESTDGWYVRARGRVQGPLTWPQLQALRERGQLARFDEISQDRRSWVPADSVERLFPRAGSGGAFVGRAAPRGRDRDRRPKHEPEPAGFLILDDDDDKAGAITGAGTGAAGAILEPSGQAADESIGWYYADAGLPQGPVEYRELRRLAGEGRIGSATLYWRSGLEQWTPGSDIPELGRLWRYEGDGGSPAAAEKLPRRDRETDAGPIPAAPRSSPLAIASLALGLLWIGGLGSAAAIVLGVLALRGIARSGGAVAGKPLAIAGLALGIGGVLFAALAASWLVGRGDGPG